MLIEKTYILERSKYMTIDWLTPIMFRRNVDDDDFGHYPSDKFFVTKVYKTEKDGWWVEIPGFNVTNRYTVLNQIRKIPDEIVIEDDLI